MYSPARRALLIVAAMLAIPIASPPAAGAQANRPAPGAARQMPDSIRFVASSRGQVYYPRGCDAWRSLSPRNVIGFASEDAARAAGYIRTRNRACRWPGDDAHPLDPYTCTVAAVSDGDTIVCRDGRRVRLLLIDAPELNQGAYGRRARTALAAMLPIGTEARLEMDVAPTDRWRRTLAYVYDAHGRMVNEEMARLGFALRLTYPPNVRHVDRIDAAVADARRSRRGLWSGSAFDCTPRDHRAARCRP